MEKPRQREEGGATREKLRKIKDRAEGKNKVM
jgi:hypothetical protein